jgi:multisubunit Na+/H+ antiporter MnhC subunit
MTDPKIADELKQMGYEPLLPVEKKLIVWSIVIGVASSGFLLWLGHKLILR